MSAVVKNVEVRFEPLTLAQLDAVLRVEQQAYAHPWGRRNFEDSLCAGYQIQLLLADDTLLGYFVAMKGVDEVHLLNLTVAPDYQRQGWAQLLLEALSLWARGKAPSGSGWRCAWAIGAPSRSTTRMDFSAWANAKTTTPVRTVSAKTRW